MRWTFNPIHLMMGSCILVVVATRMVWDWIPTPYEPQAFRGSQVWFVRWLGYLFAALAIGLAWLGPETRGRRGIGLTMAIAGMLLGLFGAGYYSNMGHHRETKEVRFERVGEKYLKHEGPVYVAPGPGIAWLEWAALALILSGGWTWQDHRRRMSESPSATAP